MNMQQTIEHNVRYVLGDLYMQTIILQAQLEEANKQLAATASEAKPKTNGHARQGMADEGAQEAQAR